MAIKKRPGGESDDRLSAFGEDPEAPPRVTGKHLSAIINRLRDDFWREMDDVPLFVPRFSSIPRTNANLKYLLQGKVQDGKQVIPAYPEAVVRTSFGFFHNDTPTLVLDRDHSCWDTYFARRARYLRTASEARAGSRDESVHKAGDIKKRTLKRLD